MAIDAMTMSFRSCWSWVVTISAVVLLAIMALLYFAGRWLSAADTPLAADAIVVLAGRPERAMYAADLYRRHDAGLVLVSRPAKENSQVLIERLGIEQESQEQLNRRILMKMGVPASRIQFLGNASVSTVDEATALRRILSPHRWRLLA